MKYATTIGVVILLFLSCKQSLKTTSDPFSRVRIETILEDSLLNIRAIEFNNNKLMAVSSIGNRYTIDVDTKDVLIDRVSTDPINFRASALVNDTFFSLSIGNPALLFKDDVLVYEETHPNVFYDALHFWNSKEGMAVGDPINGCMSVITTRDGGETWQKTPCESLPASNEGEAAFAASDTNIAIVGNQAWVATGGRSSRVFYTSDKGKSWSVFETPIIQGEETTGIFSIDFYDALNGFAIGGDYTKPKNQHSNKIRTRNGGKTWEVVAQDQTPGYRSCVQFSPNRHAKGLVAVGFEGIDYSSDSGESWKQLSEEGFYTLRFVNDSVAYAAGKGRISKLIFE
ncbi:MAG: Ycf48-like protein [Formosa sp. Hel1_33_131]|nr:MAG: Ycf48-like protein [Formosa sp. Hel1_33_131]